MTTARPLDRTMSSADPNRSFQPVHMGDVELTRPLPHLPAGPRSAWVLVRIHTEPIGVVELELDGSGMSSAVLADLVWCRHRGAIVKRLVEAGAPVPDRLRANGLAVEDSASPYLEMRKQVLDSAPFISVVVATRDRAHRLKACLDRLSNQRYPAFEVIVVENASSTETVRSAVAAAGSTLSCHYVTEPRPGLSWARNAGVANAGGDVIAFLDDDEAPDEHWLAELARGFAGGSDIGCVSGAIIPARLDTKAQDWFEQFGGHSKGRGFAPALFSRDGQQSPLFPLPPFGAGGNMAFRREVLHEIGAFDVALGAGTPARGGEDTLAITLTLLNGHRVAYQPSALVRHDHYGDYDGIAQQMQGYGVGLTAFYTALLMKRPAVLMPLLRQTPLALAYLRGGKTVSGVMDDFPTELLAVKRRGMLRGLSAYFRSRRVQLRIRSRGEGLS